ncbi:hypothetical protein E2542_SST08738 [Spatholobus suberectus]|nr:hypothetical protein E2542_SST08738 [Spatholobus suberectus]
MKIEGMSTQDVNAMSTSKLPIFAKLGAYTLLPQLLSWKNTLRHHHRTANVIIRTTTVRIAVNHRAYASRRKLALSPPATGMFLRSSRLHRTMSGDVLFFVTLVEVGIVPPASKLLGLT